ncbi:metallophosphoesterase family protein [Vulcanisaeta thermophila]|uniref:metallophosphoesterase family protein n=1 Tax=Vulcanisaeta thermophila TaxID=867917 RepID=UPI0008532DE2|nr:metallophosphoesterase family protein [Vulcanisaeta thermophila]
MNILHVSDIHGSVTHVERLLRELRGREIDAVVISGDVESSEPVMKLATLGRPTFMVLGNMDHPGLRRELRDYLIEGRIVRVGSIYIMGYPPPINYRDELRSVNGPLVLLSHYPPYNTRVDVAFDGRHIGSRDVLRLIHEVRPVLVLCGHVHEARGVDKVGDTIVVNPGPLYEGHYALISVGNEVNVNLMTL